MEKIVVITGASNGIGLASAKKFISEGWSVINLSRKPSPCKNIDNILTDVTDESNVKNSFSLISEKYGDIDVLINNAGFGISGAVEFTDIEKAKSQFDVNFFGTVNCIKAAIPLLKNKHGRIINISSAASIFAIPFQSFYSASKASVDVITRALKNELKIYGISVCALRLGDVKTSFTESRQKSIAGDDIYKGMISRSVAVMEKDENSGMSPEFIAEAIYKAANKSKQSTIATVGLKYKFLTAVNSLLPSDFVNSILSVIYMPKG